MTNKVLLKKITREEFEETIGNSFGTVGTDKGSVLSRYPTWEINGNECHSKVVFDSYEDYEEYVK